MAIDSQPLSRECDIQSQRLIPIQKSLPELSQFSLSLEAGGDRQDRFDQKRLILVAHIDPLLQLIG
jgi:hypothetical protein